MNTSKLCRFLNINIDEEKELLDITENLDEVDENTCFIALGGRKFNTHYLVEKVKEKYCPLILSDKKIEGTYFINNLKERVFEICKFFYHLDLEKIKLIAVTGTNGKTSMTHLLKQALKFYDKNVCIISTLSDDDNVFETDLTTPRASKIAKYLYLAQQKNAEYFIMEVSSIGYKELRVNGIEYDYIFLTNLKSDHLDYHKTINNYHQAKIDFISSNKKARKYFTSDINKGLDGTYVERPKLLFGNIEKQQFIFEDEVYETRLLLDSSLENLSLIIRFLKDNNFDNIKKCVCQLKPIKGRLDLVNKHPYIIIDYAHTESSMEMVLSGLKKVHHGRVIVIFGAGGERDQSKRIKYGEIALKYADVRVLTNDNPRHENPKKIISDIAGNMKDEFEIIVDRAQAIKKTLENAAEDDLVVILGKGAEEYMILEDNKISYSDYKEVEKWINKH